MEVWGRLKAFRCISNKFLYFLGGIMEIPCLDIIYVHSYSWSPGVLKSKNFSLL